MTETWRDVVGFEGAYEVSDHGHVRSLTRVVAMGHKNRPGSPTVRHTQGAPIVPWVEILPSGWSMTKCALSIAEASPAKKRTCTIIALVAASFLGPRPPNYITHAIDRDPENFAPDNLVYVPRSLSLQMRSRYEQTRDNAERELEKYISGELT